MKALGRSSSFTLSVIAVLMSTFPALAAPSSPFVGHWFTIDPFDDSAIRVTITPGKGETYNITWTEAFWTTCGGGAGLGKAVGSLAADDPNFLDFDLVVRCFTSHETVVFDSGLAYDPGSDTLTDGFGTYDRVSHP